MNLEKLGAHIKRTGMRPDEAEDYLLDEITYGSGELVHMAIIQNLIEKIDTRVAEALEYKAQNCGSEFLREIGSWEWPYPSVERKFYSVLFATMT